MKLCRTKNFANSCKKLSILGENGRSGEIRTPGPLVPNQMRYQAALHSDSACLHPHQGRYQALIAPEFKKLYLTHSLPSVLPEVARQKKVCFLYQTPAFQLSLREFRQHILLAV